MATESAGDSWEVSAQCQSGLAVVVQLVKSLFSLVDTHGV